MVKMSIFNAQNLALLVTSFVEKKTPSSKENVECPQEKIHS